MLNVGERVKVGIPRIDVANNMLEKYQGNTRTISAVHPVPTLGGCFTYELKGCEGNCGVPFTFTEDWLVKVEVEREVESDTEGTDHQMV